MKPIRGLLCVIVVVAMLFASPLFAQAIGFEAEEKYESVFVIYSGTALGSGFAIGENCIITNAHVIDNPMDVVVETYGGATHKAYVLGMDEYMDIAVLFVTDAVFPYLEIADLTAMKTGDDIYAIGAPQGMAYTLTKGGISAKEREVGGQTYIQIDAPINKGNSGGPLLNDNGQVLGVNTLKMTDSEGIGLAIPISRVCTYLQSLNVELTNAGNVVGRVEMPTQPEPTQPATEIPDEFIPDNENEEQTDTPEKAKTPLFAIVAVLVAALSLAGNVVQAVLLINERKKRVVLPPYDPTERTDFEIEILE